MFPLLQLLLSGGCLVNSRWEENYCCVLGNSLANGTPTVFGVVLEGVRVKTALYSHFQV